MTGNTPRLPGITRASPKTGRARRGVDSALKAMRGAGMLSDLDDDLIVLARVAADAVDHELARLKADPETSAAVLAQAIGRATSVAELIRKLHPDEGPDDQDPIADVFSGLGYTAPG